MYPFSITKVSSTHHALADDQRGLGELVHVGVAPAIANAVFHATGRRPRELPVTAESLL